jgi:putative DNA primase/helicase
MNRISSLEELQKKSLAGATATRATEATNENGILWEAPEPIQIQTEQKEYPIDALPGIIGDAVLEVSNFVQAPIALGAASALAAVSLACQSKINVVRDSGLEGPVSLFFLSVAASGDRKSTLDKFFSSEVAKFEREKRLEFADILCKHRSDFDSWESQRKGLLRSIQNAYGAGKDVSELKFKLVELDSRKPEEPRIPKFSHGDATVEGLRRKLSEWHSAIISSAEAGEIFGGYAMRKEQVLLTLATWNKLWSGEAINTARAQAESFNLENSRLTVCLQIQEESLNEFLQQSGKLARGSGFWARMLLAIPETLQGKRFYKSPPEKWPKLEKFNNRLNEILETQDQFDENGILKTTSIPLASDAKELWVKFHDAVESKLGKGSELAEYRDTASKIAENAARIAALLEFFQNGAVPITLDSMERAIKIVAWYLLEAQRFFDEVAISADDSKSILLNDWLVRHCREKSVNHFSYRNLLQIGPKKLRKKDLLDPVLESLAKLSRVKLALMDNEKVVMVNPLLLESES